MKRGIDSRIRRHYAEHEGTLHVFDDSSERNDYLAENPTAHIARGSDRKPRWYRQNRLNVAVWHRADGTVYVDRNGHITNVLEEGEDWGANIPTM